MILSSATILDLKRNSGLSFEQTKDFDSLSQITRRKTERRIGTPTLKRLFGYIDDNHSTSECTLSYFAIGSMKCKTEKID